MSEQKAEYQTEATARAEAAIQQKLASMFAANNDIVSIPKIYIDMVGDIEAAAVLDELMFWTLPKKGTGKTSLRVFKRGALWLAVRRKDWWDRKRLTERQADGAIAKLVNMGLVQKSVFLFDGKPTVHLRMNMGAFGKLYGDKLIEASNLEDDENLTRDIADLYAMMGLNNETVNSNLPNGEMLNLPNGEFINSPIQSPNTTPPVFLTESELKEAGDKVNKIIELSTQPKNHYVGRDMVRPDLLVYADWYNGATNQAMTKRAQKSWWKALGEWKEEGLEVAHLQEAYDARSKWRTVTDPNELTKDAVAIKALGSKPAANTQPKREEGKGFYA